MKIRKKISQRTIENLIFVWIITGFLGFIFMFGFDPLGYTGAQTFAQTQVYIAAGSADVVLNLSDNQQFDQFDVINLTANISATSGSVVGCNATLSFSNGSIFNVTGNLTNYVGDIINGQTNITYWLLTANEIGNTSVTVVTNCSMGIADTDTAFNVTVVSGITYNVSYELYSYTASGKREVFNDVKSGQATGINITVTDSDGFVVPNATIRLTEQNGFSVFAMSQIYSSSGLSVNSTGITRTDGAGTVNFTITGTGGVTGQEAVIGDYNLTLETVVGGSAVSSIPIPFVDRSIPAANGTKYDPENEANLLFVNDKLYVLYVRVKDVLNSIGSNDGGDQNYNITMYTNNTDNMPVLNGTSGRPIGLRITVVNDSTLLPVANAVVRVTENNGYNPFVKTQLFSGHGLSVEEVGVTSTNADGQVNISIVPTGGVIGQENSIGAYNLSLEAVVNGTVEYGRYLDVTDRSIPSLPANYTGEQVPNGANLQFVKDRIYVLFVRLKDWIV